MLSLRRKVFDAFGVGGRGGGSVSPTYTPSIGSVASVSGAMEFRCVAFNLCEHDNSFFPLTKDTFFFLSLTLSPSLSLPSKVMKNHLCESNVRMCDNRLYFLENKFLINSMNFMSHEQMQVV